MKRMSNRAIKGIEMRRDVIMDIKGMMDYHGTKGTEKFNLTEMRDCTNNVLKKLLVYLKYSLSYEEFPEDYDVVQMLEHFEYHKYVREPFTRYMYVIVAEDVEIADICECCIDSYVYAVLHLGDLLVNYHVEVRGIGE